MPIRSIVRKGTKSEIKIFFKKLTCLSFMSQDPQPGLPRWSYGLGNLFDGFYVHYSFSAKINLS